MNHHNNIDYWGVGRRKTATARVYLQKLEGESTNSFQINQRSLKEYFYMEPSLSETVYQPLKLFNKDKDYKLIVRVKGSGFHSQAEAIRLGIARALLKDNPEYRITLKSFGLLRRDPRQVERKKIGRHKARKQIQFSKR